MDILRAIILGIVQGITEFLPISSSGHLEIAKFILDDQSMAQDSLLMTVVLHAATALSTLVLFHKEVGQILRGLFRFQWNDEAAYTVKILLSMVPAVAVGLIFEDAIERLFDQQLLLVGLMLIVTGLLLLYADRARDRHKSVSFGEALGIGVAQAVAILPGISRSGATISASLLFGIKREDAARFSFLMVVPLILGTIGKDVMEGDLAATSMSWLTLTAGFVAEFITGYLACKLMISVVKRSKLRYFSIYCFGVAAIAIGLYWFMQ